MAGEPLPFPTSTAPSRNGEEGGGRLINAYAEKAPDGSRSQAIWRRAPGLRAYAATDGEEPRGALDVGGTLFVVNGSGAYTISSGGEVTTLTGTVPGSGPIILARNMRAPTPQILGVHSSGISSFTASAVSDFSDPDLPSSNSVTFMDGYFIFTTPSGLSYASGINDTTVSSLDFTTAEASPDGLRRAISYRGDLILMGDETTEFWGNTGNATGFPFSRGPVLQVGLKGAYAVAGMEPGFPGPLIWVGNDNAVYRLDGYQPQRISPPQLGRLIAEVEDEADISASVYIADDHPCWVLSGPTWTWVYDISAGEWHERRSYGSNRWGYLFGVASNGEWLTFRRGAGDILALDGAVFREGADPLLWEVRSQILHRFPGRFIVNRASFDMATGVGIDTGNAPIETAPRVSVSWSTDGGKSFGNALLRQLGTQGEDVSIDVRRCGLAGRKGWQCRLQVSDPVEVALMGGAVDINPRAA